MNAKKEQNALKYRLSATEGSTDNGDGEFRALLSLPSLLEERWKGRED
jgi:hypothetical protein